MEQIQIDDKVAECQFLTQVVVNNISVKNYGKPIMMVCVAIA